MKQSSSGLQCTKKYMKVREAERVYIYIYLFDHRLRFPPFRALSLLLTTSTPRHQIQVNHLQVLHFRVDSDLPGRLKGEVHNVPPTLNAMGPFHQIKPTTVLQLITV